MNITNVASSTLKVIASENLDITNDLQKADSSKTLNEILNEQEEKEQNTPDKRE